MTFVERVGVVLMYPSVVIAALGAWWAVYATTVEPFGRLGAIILAVLVGPIIAALAGVVVLSIFFGIGWTATGKNYFK